MPRKRTRRTTAKKRPTVTGDPKRTVTSEPHQENHYNLVFTTPQTSRSTPWLSEASAANLASRDCICCCALSDSCACRRAGDFHRFRSSEQRLKFFKTRTPQKKERHLNISWRCDILWCMCCISGVPRLLVQLLHEITGVLLLQALGQELQLEMVQTSPFEWLPCSHTNDIGSKTVNREDLCAGPSKRSPERNLNQAKMLLTHVSSTSRQGIVLAYLVVVHTEFIL